MIDTACIKYIDVQDTFLGVQLTHSWPARILFDGEDGIKVIMNRVMPKADAVCVAKRVFDKSQDECASLQITRDALKAGRVTDYFGNRIFPELDKNVSGWLVLWDLMPFANWDHPCKYLFIVDEKNYQVSDSEKGLDENIQLDKIY